MICGVSHLNTILRIQTFVMNLLFKASICLLNISLYSSGNLAISEKVMKDCAALLKSIGTVDNSVSPESRTANDLHRINNFHKDIYETCCLKLWISTCMIPC